jgi:hypothetical protein
MSALERSDSFWEKFVAFDPMPSGGSGPHGPWCTSCKAPITVGQRSVRIDFNNDPHGHKGFTGLYHIECSKPFASMARVLKMLSFRGF